MTNQQCNQSELFPPSLQGIPPAVKPGGAHLNRFMSKVDRAGSCWVWKACKTPRGYGHFYFDKKHWRAHRWAYQYFKGPIPEGLELDHLCRNTSCVNPDHLEAVTHKVNILRGQSPQAGNARKERCDKGHVFDRSRKSGGRWCSTCNTLAHSTPEYIEAHRKKSSEYYYKNRERILESMRIKWAQKKAAE